MFEVDALIEPYPSGPPSLCVRETEKLVEDIFPVGQTNIKCIYNKFLWRASSGTLFMKIS